MGECSPEKLVDGNYPVLRVELDADKDFMRQSCKLVPEKVPHVGFRWPLTGVSK